MKPFRRDTHVQRYWDRYVRAVAVWKAKSVDEIGVRLVDHARRCPRGCSFRDDQLVVELTCWTGSVLYEAWPLSPLAVGVQLSRLDDTELPRLHTRMPS